MMFESQINAFMDALKIKESGGNEDALSWAGASGLYQIMPGNWDLWSKEAGADPLDRSPANQYYVAKMHVISLYNKYGNWQDVASAWYGGDSFKEAYNHDQLETPIERGSGKFSPLGQDPSIAQYGRDFMAIYNRLLGSTVAGQVSSLASGGKASPSTPSILDNAKEYFNKFLAFTVSIVVIIMGFFLISSNNKMIIEKEGD